MNSAVAKYLFEKEILYKNSEFIEKRVEKEIIKPKKEIETLIVEEEKSTKIEEKKSASVELKHKVLILVNSISDSERELLSKIIKAINLSLEQVDLLELDKLKNVDYESVIAQKVTTKVISFGVGFNKIGINLITAPYQIKKLDSVNFLLADSLKSISDSQTLKKNLWAILQKMFL